MQIMLLKPFKLCLYVKQNSQGSHSPKLSLVIIKVGPTLTSSPPPFPSSYRSGNSLSVFSAISAFNGASHCENRALTRVLAGRNLSVTRKNRSLLCALCSGPVFFPRSIIQCMRFCSSSRLLYTFITC